MPTSKTKQLAKTLGLVKRAQDLVCGRDSNKRRRAQVFSHILVLDFESTCWKGRKGKQEIIEFPCVLVDTGEGKVLSHFQQYVQPQENPVLSSFCTELTGISQDKVDNGVPLPTCLMLFGRWLREIEEKEGFKIAMPGEDYSNSNDDLCAIATWTDWDLEVCLNYECQRKEIKKPEYFNQWIDLRGTYKTFYERKPAGLSGALQDLGIKFEGREHCGLDDARNTAYLCIRLINDGCQLKITKSIHKTKVASGIRRPMLVSSVPQDKQTLSSVENCVDAQVHSAFQKTLDCTSKKGIGTGLENDSFNIPAEAWLEINVTDPQPVHVPSSEPSLKTVETGIPVTSVADPTHAKGSTCGILPSNKEVLSLEKDELSKATTSSNLKATPVNCVLTSNASTNMASRRQGQLCSPLSCSHDNLVSPFSIRTDSMFKTSTPILSANEPSSVFRTNNSSSSLFKTPSMHLRTSRSLSLTGCCSSVGKVTPPLCKCGKRTKRKHVNSSGPNEGKPFYCCSVSRLKGCGFFEWESSVVAKYSEYTPEILTSEYD